MTKLHKQLKDRWQAPTPIFWQKIMKKSIQFGSSAVAILMADQMFGLQDNYGIPQIIFKICGYIVVFCAAVGLSAKITKQNNNEDD